MIQSDLLHSSHILSKSRTADHSKWSEITLCLNAVARTLSLELFVWLIFLDDVVQQTHRLFAK
ncbi:hypothetical protein J6590_087171 [Homalodisca vitripennis]|nr:hypothetical protein J6590_087171 [Homalodisca vitripennis]